MTIDLPEQDTEAEDLDALLDHLLILWHNHRQGYRTSRGYSRSDSTCRDYRAPGHYDWANGAADARAEELEVKAIDDAMESIPNTPRRWRTSLEFNARNLVTGASVWRSPVLPQNQEERDILLLEARNMLLRVLKRNGVLGG